MLTILTATMPDLGRFGGGAGVQFRLTFENPELDPEGGGFCTGFGE